MALLKDLDKVPRHAYSFLWADYVELRCLTSTNGMVSKGNLDSQKQEAQDVQIDANEDIVDDHTMESEELDDLVSKKWADIRLRLNVRSQQYADWPFVLEKNLIRLKFDPKNSRQRLYIALLVASSLRLCKKERENEVTSAFEEISFHWLKRTLTEQWEVRPFGAHQTLPGAYTGTLWNKLSALAQDIRARLAKSEEDYEPQNTGDGDIDLVAWLKMGDQRGNLPVIFGQCACSPTDWEDKQLDVGPSATEAHIAPQHPAAAYCFVPHDLSASLQKWERASHVKRTVFVDRLRLFKIFEQTNAFDHLPTWSFVDDAANTKTAPTT